jgi:hypothetical protein
MLIDCLISGPADRYGATLTGHGQRAYLFGGARREPHRVLNELWEFDLTKGWTKMPVNQPLYVCICIYHDIMEAQIYLTSIIDTSFGRFVNMTPIVQGLTSKRPQLPVHRALRPRTPPRHNAGAHPY